MCMIRLPLPEVATSELYCHAAYRNAEEGACSRSLRSLFIAPALGGLFRNRSQSSNANSCRTRISTTTGDGLTLHRNKQDGNIQRQRSSSVARASGISSGGKAILGIDVGTSATKAALCYVGEKGMHRPVARSQHQTRSAGSSQVTQCTDSWFTAACETARDVLQADGCHAQIVAISVTGQMQDLIAVGEAPPELLSQEAILYSDARAQDLAEVLTKKCGTYVDATSILAKLALLPSPLHSVGAKYSLLLGAADYVINSFAADPKPVVTDATTVSTTGLTKAPHRDYDSHVISAAGLSSFLPLLPSILAGPSIVGYLCKSVARQLGRPDLAGIPLIHAGGDAFSATVGAGRDRQGSGSYIYCGTSGWIGGTADFGTSAFRRAEGLFSLGHGGDPSAEISLASLAAAGGYIDFVGKTLLDGLGPAEMDRLAISSPVGANGLLCTPYITGRRCPAPDPTVAGTLVGLRTSTSKADIARAAIEGVVFAFARAAETLPEELRRSGEPLRMVGGGARSKTLVGGLAALLGEHAGIVRAGPDCEVGIVGAARVAAKAIGLCDGRDWWIDGDSVISSAEEQREWRKAFQNWLRKA